MNEAETRAELIDPALRALGWDVPPGTKVHREYIIAPGKIQVGGRRKNLQKADYVLTYKNRMLAVIEAKSDEQAVGEGVAQAKEYALKLKLETAYAANGREVYFICMDSGTEGLRPNFLNPDELWLKTFPEINKLQEQLTEQPFETRGGTRDPRYYQEIAIERVLDAIGERKKRILLTLATGTGKTNIAMQIAWKLYNSKWNLHYDGSRVPRVLFLADRNILANQAFNDFTPFPEDALVRIKPGEIKKKGRVPVNGSVFFTIFQTFMSGPNETPYFGGYPPDFFDLIIIDECHRGGANDESTWRSILEYFSPAVQLGLTATPKRKENVDTYEYFGKPVYTYSLKEGINDGFLTPFKVRKYTTSLDEYTWDGEDDVIDGDIKEGHTYTEAQINRHIEILEREEYRVKLFMDEINQDEKTLVFCATQKHAALVRDLINQYKKSKDINYCVRVTANDGELGEQYLRDFQDNERSTPTILTTSQKLSTGVDARNVRNIVLMRPVNNMIEFKQIIGRGTRLFEGKEFFTIYDFVKAYENFNDPEWDGEPEYTIDIKEGEKKPKDKETEDAIAQDEGNEYERKEKKNITRVKLRSGREITHTAESSFFDNEGKPISAQQFLNNLYGELPRLFTSEEELRRLWSLPDTRKALLDELDNAGFDREQLGKLQSIIDASKCDLFDVLEYISYSQQPQTREQRATIARSLVAATLTPPQKEFVDFVLSKYIENGVDELEQEKLPQLLILKYRSIPDAKAVLGNLDTIRETFISFQKFLYSNH